MFWKVFNKQGTQRIKENAMKQLMTVPKKEFAGI